ncbi:Acyl-lipid 8-3-desaturase [Hondaea fermentalgiana]|uniref:Acyl-lipid 8-3-desaturase n=1 Tax=Hondaea fermentalgiana TaxID=2315210 RepID=A0A2R5GAP1_9STRA|nr:Acyl-lipid 8-3-desaturase [Hondaea fermentalgiana]|eukprot:GBG24764.1 Acyl-lipid 8-3-desaturase [Hondaea fermentalgiana]
MGKGSEGRSAVNGVQTSANSQSNKPKAILIEGVLYDVTNFRHPGGSIIDFLTEGEAGVDATQAYREFHQRSGKADKYLKSLPKLDVSKVKSRFSSKEQARRDAMTKDYAEFREQLIKEGYFDPSLPHMTYRVVEIVVLFVLSFWLMGQSSPLALALGIVVSGISQGRCGWVMHEMGHGSFTGVIWLDDRLCEFFYGVGCGMSGHYWKNQHSKHHAAPNRLEHDVDLNTLPLVAFNERVVRKVRPGTLLALWLRVQAYLFAPVSCLLIGLGWTLYLHPRYMMRTKRWMEFVWIAVRYVAWFGVMGALGYTPGQSLGMYLCAFGLGCIYIFLQFAVSHTHLPVSNPEDQLHWLEYAADHTVNISTKSWFVTWWMSNLNFQIEHHLFPTAPQFRFKEISPRVEALFKRHGLPYYDMPYTSAVSTTFANLYSVGHSVGDAKRD